MIEEWKLYKETYNTRWGTTKWELSNFGRVKKNGEIIECRYTTQGYEVFGHGYRLHRCVAELFIVNDDNSLEVDHIDGNKLNNRVDNLRWVTHKDNMNNPITVERFSGTHRVYDNDEHTKWHMVRDAS